MRKYKILCLVHLPPPIHGVAMMSETVVNALRMRADLKIRVLPIQFSKSISEIGRYDARKALRIMALAGKLFKECLLKRPDLVYYTITPTGPAFYRDLLFVAILKLLRIPRVYHLHGKGMAPAIKEPMGAFTYRWAFSEAQVIFLASRLYSEISPIVPKENSHVLPNGIPDPAVYDEGPGENRNSDPGVPVILYFSNVADSKGALVLLKALAELKKKNIPFRARFAGVMESEAFRQLFFATMRGNNLTGDVEYLGPKYGAEKVAVFKDADIMAFPTNNDTFPLVLLEAMSHGLPVVSTREGAIEDIVEDGRTGFLIAKNDHEALAEKLYVLLTQPDLRHEMGQQARQQYEESYTSVVFTNNLNRTIDSCLRRAITESTTHKNDG